MTKPIVQSLPIPGVHVSQSERVLRVWSDEPLTVLSSAVVGGELSQTRHILNMHVPNNFASDAPAADLRALAQKLDIVEPFIGLMTAAKLERSQAAIEQNAATRVAAVVTVGLSHPVAAGITEAAALSIPPGTINIILIADAQLTPAARVNAVITATEAKTLALVEAGVRAPHGGPASGTGTDAIVVASTGRGQSVEYAGPIAPIGALIGQAVRRAIQNALASR